MFGLFASTVAFTFHYQLRNREGAFRSCLSELKAVGGLPSSVGTSHSPSVKEKAKQHLTY